MALKKISSCYLGLKKAWMTGGGPTFQHTTWKQLENPESILLKNHLQNFKIISHKCCLLSIKFLSVTLVCKIIWLTRGRATFQHIAIKKNWNKTFSIETLSQVLKINHANVPLVALKPCCFSKNLESSFFHLHRNT